MKYLPPGKLIDGLFQVIYIVQTLVPGFSSQGFMDNFKEMKTVSSFPDGP